jgi:hypothetical protein
MADLLDLADFPELFQALPTKLGHPSVSGLDVDVLLYQEADPDTLDFSATFNPADWEPWILTRGRRKGTQVFRHLKNRKYYRDTLPEGYGLIGTQILSTLSSKEYDVREVDVRVLDQASRILVSETGRRFSGRQDPWYGSRGTPDRYCLPCHWHQAYLLQ